MSAVGRVIAGDGLDYANGAIFMSDVGRFTSGNGHLVSARGNVVSVCGHFKSADGNDISAVGLENAGDGNEKAAATAKDETKAERRTPNAERRMSKAV